MGHDTNTRSISKRSSILITDRLLQKNAFGLAIHIQALDGLLKTDGRIEKRLPEEPDLYRSKLQKKRKAL
jgi:hypothetical protein